MAKNKDGIKASKPSKEDIGSKSVKSGHVGKASNAQSLGTIKFGGKSKPTKAASDSEDSETSDSSASSESESEEESEEESKARPAPKTNGHANGKSKAVKNESDDSESSEEESGSDDDEMEASADKPAKANGAKVASKKTQESDDSEDESDDGNSDEESDEEEKPAKAAGEKKTSAKAAKVRYGEYIIDKKANFTRPLMMANLMTVKKTLTIPTIHQKKTRRLSQRNVKLMKRPSNQPKNLGSTWMIPLSQQIFLSATLLGMLMRLCFVKPLSRSELLRVLV